jgi:hypothetical protein
MSHSFVGAHVVEPLFWFLGGVALVLWIVFSWGKSVGVEESRYAHNQVKYDLGRKIERLEEDLKESARAHRLEMAALESALAQIRKHRDALRPAASLLTDVRTYSPSWLCTDPFLLLGPGQMKEYQAWATHANGIWQQIDRLSGPARLALEQAYNTNVNQPLVPAPVVPLVTDVLKIASTRPSELADHNLFELRAEHFQELAEWFGRLSQVASDYIARISDIEESELRLQQLTNTREAIQAS